MEDPDATMKTVTTADVNAVTTADVNAVTTADVNAVTTADVDAVTPADVDAVTPADVNAVTPADVDAVTPADMDAVTPADVNAVTPADVNAVTTADMDAVTTADMDAVTAADMDAVTAANVFNRLASSKEGKNLLEAYVKRQGFTQLAAKVEANGALLATLSKEVERLRLTLAKRKPATAQDQLSAEGRKRLEVLAQDLRRSSALRPQIDELVTIVDQISPRETKPQAAQAEPPLASQVMPSPASQIMSPPASQIMSPPASQIMSPPASQVMPPPASQVMPPPASQVMPSPASQIMSPPASQASPPLASRLTEGRARQALPWPHEEVGAGATPDPRRSPAGLASSKPPPKAQASEASASLKAKSKVRLPSSEPSAAADSRESVRNRLVSDRQASALEAKPVSDSRDRAQVMGLENPFERPSRESDRKEATVGTGFRARPDFAKPLSSAQRRVPKFFDDDDGKAARSARREPRPAEALLKRPEPAGSSGTDSVREPKGGSAGTAAEAFVKLRERLRMLQREDSQARRRKGSEKPSPDRVDVEAVMDEALSRDDGSGSEVEASENKPAVFRVEDIHERDEDTLAPAGEDPKRSGFFS